MPLRSLLIVALAGYEPLYELDAVAVAPRVESAKFVDVAAEVAQASTSVMRAWFERPIVTFTRIRSVVKAANVTVRLTNALPVTVARVTQLEPFQPCTEKSRKPYRENVMVSVGSRGAVSSSW